MHNAMGVGLFIIFLMGGGGRWGWERNFCCPLGGVITWHRAVECLVSGSNRVICILPLLLSYKYDDIRPCTMPVGPTYNYIVIDFKTIYITIQKPPWEENDKFKFYISDK